MAAGYFNVASIRGSLAASKEFTTGSCNKNKSVWNIRRDRAQVKSKLRVYHVAWYVFVFVCVCVREREREPKKRERWVTTLICARRL